MSLLRDMKRVLVSDMRAAKVTRAELCRRLGWQRHQVDRLFNRWHNSSFASFQAAFDALGTTPVFEIKDLR
jgi:antitoxin HicB